MKYFIACALALCLFTTTSNAANTFPTYETDSFVEVTVQLVDGSSCATTVQLSDLHLVSEKSFDLTVDDVFDCTYKFSDNSCSSTAATCAEAYVGFAGCACSTGHDRYCAEA